MPSSQEPTSFRSISLLSVCSLAQLILQFAFQVLLANLFGTKAEMDAYLAALALPSVLSTILVGSLGFTFVPIFIDVREKRGDDAAWRLASNIGIRLFVVSIVGAIVGLAFAQPLMQGLFASTKAGAASADLELTKQLFQILVWTIVTINLTTFLRAVYHCCGRFTPTGIAPVASTLTTIVVVVFGYSTYGISSVAYGFLAGTIVSTVIQLPLFLKNIRSPKFEKNNSDAKRFLKLLFPLMLGAAYYNLDPIIDRHLASQFPGGISLLGYASRLATAIVTIATTGLAVVVFPKFSQLATENDDKNLEAEIAGAFRFLGFVIVPIVIGLALFSKPVVGDLLQRGEFTVSDTSSVARLLVLYLGMIAAAALGEVAARAFYALKDTRTPVVIGVTGFTLGSIVKIWLAGTQGIDVIAAATSGYFVFNICCLMAILSRRLSTNIFRGVQAVIGRAIVGSSVAAAAAWGVLALDFACSSLAATAVGLTVYVVVSYALGDEFATASIRFVTRKTDKIDPQE